MQRIVGALVLLALAVIIIPMVLDLRKGYDVSIDKTNIPPRPEDFRVEVLPLLEEDGGAPLPREAPPAPAGTLARAPAPAPAPEAAPAPAVEAPAPQPAPVAREAAPPPRPAAAPPKAVAQERKPVAQTPRGTKPSPPPVSAPKPKPKPKPKPRPVQPPPLAKPPPPTSLPAPSAWVLQVGNFGSRKNADALRERLRRNGFRAFVDEKVKGGATTYRVFVGPELIKGNTDILKRELKEDLNLNGIVIPYER